jgi:hypothetical protein
LSDVERSSSNHEYMYAMITPEVWNFVLSLKFINFFANAGVIEHFKSSSKTTICEFIDILKLLERSVSSQSLPGYKCKIYSDMKLINVHKDHRST